MSVPIGKVARNCVIEISLNEEELTIFWSTPVMLKLFRPSNHKKGCLSLSYPVMVEEMALSMTESFEMTLRL